MKSLNEPLNNKNPLASLLFISITILALIGIVAVYSASNYIAKLDYNNEFYFAIKQAIGVIIGFIVMIITSNINYQVYRGKGFIFFLIGVVLLAVLFIPGVGREVYGAKRWINLGFITIQPSEIAKFGLVFFIADYLGKDLSRGSNFLGVLPILVGGGLTCLLIMIEPNMSITVCVGLVMLIMLFLGGVKIKIFVIILLPIIALIPILIIIEPYRLKRLMAFINPWSSPQGEGYQLLQSLYGLGSGGLFGVGLFNSRQKYRFLPFSESDFILSIIGEEVGFFGTLLLFLFILFIIFVGIQISKRAKDFYGYMLANGIISVFAVQVIINALVVTGSIPPTGLPLPLISSGNTSVVVFMAMFGVVINISKNKSNLPSRIEY